MRRAWAVWSALVVSCSAGMSPGLDGDCRLDGEVRCDAEGVRLLECQVGRWVILSDCRGPARCQNAGGEVRCDSSGNGAGHHCLPSSEGKVRCEPDGGAAILRCRDGVLQIERSCAEPERCVQEDGGLSCGA